MSDHQTQEGTGPAETPTEPVSTQDQFKEAIFGGDAEDAPATEDSEDPVPGEPEGDLEAEDFEEEGEPEGEQETVIAIPISLNAEEKETYGQLPPEAQAFVTALEARRSADVTKVTTKAADAQRAAQAQAAEAAIEAKRVYAAQLTEIGNTLLPTEPKRQHFANDVEYLVATRQYDQQVAQHSQWMQQVGEIGQEAQAEDQKSFVETRDKALMQIPEIANEETRQAYLDRVFDTELHARLNYAPGEVAKIADADDVRRLTTIAKAFEKADKYDAAMDRKMTNVRKGKTRSTRPNAAQQRNASSSANAYQTNVAKLKSSGSNQDAQNAFKAVFSKK